MLTLKPFEMKRRPQPNVVNRSTLERMDHTDSSLVRIEFGSLTLLFQFLMHITRSRVKGRTLGEAVRISTSHAEGVDISLFSLVLHIAIHHTRAEVSRTRTQREGSTEGKTITVSADKLEALRIRIARILDGISDNRGLKHINVRIELKPDGKTGTDGKNNGLKHINVRIELKLPCTGDKPLTQWD